MHYWLRPIEGVQLRFDNFGFYFEESKWTFLFAIIMLLIPTHIQVDSWKIQSIPRTWQKYTLVRMWTPVFTQLSLPFVHIHGIGCTDIGHIHSIPRKKNWIDFVQVKSGPQCWFAYVGSISSMMVNRSFWGLHQSFCPESLCNDFYSNAMHGAETVSAQILSSKRGSCWCMVPIELEDDIRKRKYKYK